MSDPQDWRPLVQALEAYIDATADRSPLVHLSRRYPSSAPVHGAVLQDISALLRQADSLAQSALVTPSDIAPVQQAAPVEVTSAADGRWLKVGHRTLRGLRNKQQDFVLIMVEAYHAQEYRPRIEWVLRRAGYGEGIYDLRHISRRPAFHQFFAQSAGECWIVTDPPDVGMARC